MAQPKRAPAPRIGRRRLGSSNLVSHARQISLVVVRGGRSGLGQSNPAACCPLAPAGKRHGAIRADTFAVIIDRWADDDPQRRYLRDGTSAPTYGQFREQGWNLAAGLARRAGTP